jgi:hypothetical protein
MYIRNQYTNTTAIPRTKLARRPSRLLLTPNPTTSRREAGGGIGYFYRHNLLWDDTLRAADDVVLGSAMDISSTFIGFARKHARSILSVVCLNARPCICRARGASRSGASVGQHHHTLRFLFRATVGLGQALRPRQAGVGLTRRTTRRPA